MLEFQMLVFADKDNFAEGIIVAWEVLYVNSLYGLPSDAMSIITDPRTDRPMMFVNAIDTRLLRALNLTLEDAGVDFIPLITL